MTATRELIAQRQHRGIRREHHDFAARWRSAERTVDCASPLLHDLDPLFVGMVWTFGAGGKIFVYQSAPLVVGYSYGYFGVRDMLRVGTALTLVESAVLALLVPFYWPLIGI